MSGDGGDLRRRHRPSYQGTVNLTLRTAAELLEISGFVVDVLALMRHRTLSVYQLSISVNKCEISEFLFPAVIHP